MKKSLQEMLTHIPLCTHKEPKSVFVVSDNEDILEEEAQKHGLEFAYGSQKDLSTKGENELDVILFTQAFEDELLLANVNMILKDDGIIVIPSANFDDDAQKLKSDLMLLGTSFWIAMPYSFEDHTFILASKKYHPTADIVLQKSDLLVGMHYYNTQMHHCVFTYPTYIHEELTTIARR